jgi:hypothetical protein
MVTFCIQAQTKNLMIYHQASETIISKEDNEQDYEIRLSRLKISFQNEEEKDYTKNKFSRKEFEEKECI